MSCVVVNSCTVVVWRIPISLIEGIVDASSVERLWEKHCFSLTIWKCNKIESEKIMRNSSYKFFVKNIKCFQWGLNHDLEWGFIHDQIEYKCL